MASHKDSVLDSATKNLDLTLTLSIPIPARSDSSNSSPNISLELVGIPLLTPAKPPSILPPSQKDLEETGNWLSPHTIGGQVP